MKNLEYKDLESKEMTWDALLLSPKDNVATALKHLLSGSLVRIKTDQDEIFLKIEASIPLCHKFSISKIKNGDAIYKYGIEIGRATSSIGLGKHVHVHNLASERAKLSSQTIRTRLSLP